jgi:hypothetical protein
MDLRQRTEIESLARTNFAFLTTEKGFTLDLRIDKWIWFTNFLYCKPDIGIEIGLDFYDKDVDVDIVPLEDGEIPVKPFGGQVKWDFLRHIVNDLRIRDPLITEVKQLNEATPYSQRDMHFASRKLALYHSLVRKYVDQISCDAL